MEPGESSRFSGARRLSVVNPAIEPPTITTRLSRGTDNPLSPAGRRGLKMFARELALRLTGERPFHCLLTDDKKLRELNHQFLGKDYATDVLSFPGVDAESAGDLAISLQRAQAQAEAFGHSLTDEVQLLMLHGVLHLIGYDHEQDAGEMAREERKWRSVFHLPQTLIQRTRSRAGARQ